MKKLTLLLLAVVEIVLASCMSSVKPVKGQLTNTTWELEYITGPRIAFSGLYPDKKPTITFNAETKKIEGNDSCNGYSADYSVSANLVVVGEPGISTMMYCGEGEKVFLNTIKKINKFNVGADGKLTLSINNIAMMRFKKAGK